MLQPVAIQPTDPDPAHLEVLGHRNKLDKVLDIIKATSGGNGLEGGTIEGFVCDDFA